MTFLKQDFEAPDDKFLERVRKERDAWSAKYGDAYTKRDAKRNNIVWGTILISLILAVSSLVVYIMGVV